MPHITIRDAETIDQQITDMNALEAACRRCGLEFHPGQKAFRASAKGGLAAAKHAIGMAGKVEIGVVESARFPGTYSLAYGVLDDALVKVATTEECRMSRSSRHFDKLKMYYRAEAARN